MKKQRANRTLYTIVRSYIMILLLPMLFGILLYSIALQMVRTEETRAQMQVLNQVEEQVNFTLENMNSIIDTFMVSNKVTKLSYQQSFDRSNYLLMKEIQQELLLTKLSNDYIDDLILYFYRADTLLSCRYTLNNVSGMPEMVDLLRMTTSDFSENLPEDENLHFFIVSHDIVKEPYVVRANANLTQSGVPTVAILVRFNRVALKNLMTAENSETFLLDEKGQYFCTDGAEAIGVPMLTTGDNYRDYRVLKPPQSLLSMQYIRLVEKDIYTQNVFKMELLLWGYIILCLVVGIPLTASMARKSYDPIKQIISILPNASSEQDANDFRQIEKSLSDLMNRNAQNEELLNKQDEAMKNYYMYKIIRDGVGYQEKFLEGCRRFNISFSYENYLLIGFDIEDGSNLFFENPEPVNKEMSRLVFFAISNILSSKIGDDYPFFLAEYDGLFLALVNIDARFDSNHILDYLSTISKELCVRMELDFRVVLSVSFSCIHRGLSKVPKCYEEIQEILEYRSVRKAPPVLLFSDIEEYETMAVIEKAAIREIRSHSYNKAQDLLKEAIRVIDPQSTDPLDAESECLPDKGSKSLNAILAYIDGHFTDSNLSVAAIAEAFNMTPSYLSLYFKRKMNITPLEYIHSKRLEQVKLLLESDLPIKAIARRTGYFDTRPMIRFFKRAEGCTPTEYREKLRQQDL